MVKLLGSTEPIFELRSNSREERKVRPGQANSESGSAVMAVDSRRRLVREVKLVNELGKEPPACGTIKHTASQQKWALARYRVPSSDLKHLQSSQTTNLIG